MLLYCAKMTLDQLISNQSQDIKDIMGRELWNYVTPNTLEYLKQKHTEYPHSSRLIGIIFDQVLLYLFFMNKIDPLSNKLPNEIFYRKPQLLNKIAPGQEFSFIINQLRNLNINHPSTYQFLYADAWLWATTPNKLPLIALLTVQNDRFVYNGLQILQQNDMASLIPLVTKQCFDIFLDIIYRVNLFLLFRIEIPQENLQQTQAALEVLKNVIRSYGEQPQPAPQYVPKLLLWQQYMNNIVKLYYDNSTYSIVIAGKKTDPVPVLTNQQKKVEPVTNTKRPSTPRPSTPMPPIPKTPMPSRQQSPVHKPTKRFEEPQLPNANQLKENLLSKMVINGPTPNMPSPVQNRVAQTQHIPSPIKNNPMPQDRPVFQAKKSDTSYLNKEEDDLELPIDEAPISIKPIEAKESEAKSDFPFSSVQSLNKIIKVTPIESTIEIRPVKKKPPLTMQSAGKIIEYDPVKYKKSLQNLSDVHIFNYGGNAPDKSTTQNTLEISTDNQETNKTSIQLLGNICNKNVLPGEIESKPVNSSTSRSDQILNFIGGFFIGLCVTAFAINKTTNTTKPEKK